MADWIIFVCFVCFVIQTLSSVKHLRTSLAERLADPDLTMLVVVLIWAGNYSAIKAALVEMDPYVFLAVRFLLATVLLVILLYWREGGLSFPEGSFWKLVWLGVIGNTSFQLFFVNGVARTTSANSSLMVTTTPLIIALAGRLAGIEKITRKTAIGLALALAGVAIVMLMRGASVSRESITGDLLVLGAVLSWAIYVLGLRTVIGEISSLRVTALTMVTGTPGLMIAAVPGLMHTDWHDVGIKSVISIFYSGCLALVVSYIIYNRSVRLIGGVRTSIYMCMIPVVAALIAWPVIGEKPTLIQALGAILISAGVLIAQRR